MSVASLWVDIFSFLAPNKYPRFGKNKASPVTAQQPKFFRTRKKLLTKSTLQPEQKPKVIPQSKLDNFVFVPPARKERPRKSVNLTLPRKRIIDESDSDFNSGRSDTDSQSEFTLPARKRPQRKRRRTYALGSDFEV